MITPIDVGPGVAQRYLRKKCPWFRKVACVCATAAVLTTTAAAQDRIANPKIKLDIPANMSLEQALLKWSAVAGIQLMMATDAVSERRARPLHGEISAIAALRQLLEGSSLKYSVTGNTVRIVPESAFVRSVDHAARSQPVPLTDDSKGDSSEEGSQDTLAQVVVTAQKREERLQDVPISISVLSGQALDRSSYSGVTEALNTVPSVTAAPNFATGGTHISIRGVGASGPILSGSSPVGYYLDAVPFGLVKNAIFPDANVYDLQQIEVLRGPQGTLYGANAENGLVRVLTHDADLQKFEVKARSAVSNTDSGSGPNYSADAAVNVPLVEGKLAARAVVDYSNLSGWISGPAGTHLNDAELRNYRLKIDSQPIAGLTIGASAWSTRDDNGAPDASTKDRRTLALIPEPIKTDYDAYGLKAMYDFGPLTLASTTSYLDYDSDSTSDLNAAYGPGDGLALITDLAANVFAEEIVLNSAAESPWRWTAGAMYRDARDRLRQSVPSLAVLISMTDTSRSYAAYGQFGRKFLRDQFEWSLGARYFHDTVSDRDDTPGGRYEQDAFHATTPRAVLSWYPVPDVTVYGSYSQGFRSGAPQYLALVPAGFPAAKPDKLHNYELGGKADFLDRRLSVDTAVYYMKWDDVQQLITVPYGSLNVAAVVNGQSASGAGVDLSITGRPINGLQVGISTGWNDLTMDAPVVSGGVILFHKGDRLNYSPSFTGSVFTDYSFPLAGQMVAKVSASGTFSSTQSAQILTATTAQGNSDGPLFIARAAFSLILDAHWAINLFGDNLTNEDRGVPSNVPVGAARDARLRPRTVGLRVDYNR